MNKLEKQIVSAENLSCTSIAISLVVGVTLLLTNTCSDTGSKLHSLDTRADRHYSAIGHVDMRVTELERDLAAEVKHLRYENCVLVGQIWRVAPTVGTIWFAYGDSIRILRSDNNKKWTIESVSGDKKSEFTSLKAAQDYIMTTEEYTSKECK